MSCNFLRALCLLLSIVSTCVYATGPGAFYEEQQHLPTPVPWFTGPLLTPSGYVIPKGHVNIEPYIFATETLGNYNANWDSQPTSPKLWTIRSRNMIKVGVFDGVDIGTSPQALYKIRADASSAGFGDLPVSMDFQLLKSGPHYWYPNIKLVLREIFPTGKFQKGNPKKNGTDLFGTGSFETELGVAMSHLFHITGLHYINSRFFLSYTIPSSVHVKSFNTYGGGFGTDAKGRPGNFLTLLTALEFSLSQNWSLACDFRFQCINKTKFSGNFGTTTKGGTTSASLGSPASAQFSLAPAIEYNFSQNLGLIAGSWFTFAGRNSSEFVSYVIALNYFK